ncbi:hypothetical protein ACVR0O_01600 [Streptococcus caviae]|uniref:hypothetical protein n=1 Tax=Streptococcus sp. 'caviae' TaxID=1915004 RepID=UPI00094B99F4|nr:hypothetical protein [Streptococcus sp. 'caviae']OLN84573.1 hypothetical protein BMI76_00390 [Streptococcus sp. 'caviae']
MNREMTTIEANVLDVILNRGSFKLPVKAEKIRNDLGLSKRGLEEIVETLRFVHGHPIVAKKTQPSGYYIPRNKDEREAGITPYRKQIATEKRNLGAVLSVDLTKYWERA